MPRIDCNIVFFGNCRLNTLWHFIVSLSCFNLISGKKMSQWRQQRITVEYNIYTIKISVTKTRVFELSYMQV